MHNAHVMRSRVKDTVGIFGRVESAHRLYQKTNQIALENNLEMSLITIVCSFKHFTSHRFRFMEGELPC